MAELWGVYYGLYTAWELGHRRLVVDVNSKIVVGFLRKGVVDTHLLSFLVACTMTLFICRDWIVRFVHVYIGK